MRAGVRTSSFPRKQKCCIRSAKVLFLQESVRRNSREWSDSEELTFEISEDVPGEFTIEANLQNRLPAVNRPFTIGG